MKAQQLIDRFVAIVNSSVFQREPLWSQEVPPIVRDVENTELGDYFDWRIKPVSYTPWIDDLEGRLPKRFPCAFRSLLSRYLFPAFEVDSLFLFGNTGTKIHDELAERIFADPALHPTLLKHGYVQFGNPSGGSYDPVCFDTSRGSNENPIVILDHEKILMYSEIRVIEELSRSFERFVSDFVAKYEEV